MKNLVKLYSNELENNESQYLYFNLGDSKYAIKIQQVVEIMKLPLLDYPQKLANNIVGLLNYNNFTINILDLRFYLNIKVTPYSISNQLLIVKTDETIFGLIIDKVEDIISLDQSKTEFFHFNTEEKIIEFLYKQNDETLSVISLSAVEEIIKHGVESSDIDIPALFPHDDDSKYKLKQRNQALIEKSQLNLTTNVFSQDKFISFSLNEIDYCINLKYVSEFLKKSSITKIPCDLDYIAGIMTLRGDFITIVDIKKILGLEEINPYENISGKHSIIIIEIPDYKIGFLVDKIFRIIDIPEELINENSHNQSDKFVFSEVLLEDKMYTILNMGNI
jgi:purine-binding chemotaxis protein CheW